MNYTYVLQHVPQLFIINEDNMMPEKSSDLLTQYKAISNKLKKRFLRKPNTTEPSDQFASLAAQCERSDLSQYAALSWLAVAKCEASLAHKNEEAIALQRAGRLFLEAERKNVIGCNEHIQSGIFCLNQVEELWGDDNPLTAALCFETGSALESISPHHAVSFFERSSSLFSHSPALHLHALGKLASSKIAVGDYHGAMSLFTDMVSTVYKITSLPFGVYKDILVRCEISRVLLILLLQPTPQKISPDLAKFVEKYTWIGEPDPKTVSWLGEELFFLLQSLVMSCQCQDLEAVHDLESDLWKYFNNEQKIMLHTIIKSMNNSDK